MILYPFLPGLYFVETRLKGLTQKISWIIIYLIPIFTFYFWNISKVTVSSSIALVLAIILVNLIYENGYIQNDVWTTRRESKPTQRLSELDSDFIFKHAVLIFSVRLLWFVVLTAALSMIVKLSYFIHFIYGIILLQGIFSTYNLFRSKVNLYLILPLSYLRFYLPLLILVSINDNLYFLLSLFLLYPVPKFLEFCKQPRYGMHLVSKIVGNIDRFRVFYYLFLIVISSVIFYFSNIPHSDFLLFISTFYFLYRLSGYLLIKRSARFNRAVLKGAKEEYRK